MLPRGEKWGRVAQSGGHEAESWSEEEGPPMFFLGTHTPKLDEKGRLFLPAKFRDALADGLVITRFQERCLAIWPLSAFVEMAQAARGASSSQQVRDYQRMLASGASDDTPDKQGRITIPPHLRAYAGLDKDCVVVGAINRVEIWDALAWQEYSAEKESAYAELNETVFPVH
jgi:MraZ protein